MSYACVCKYLRVVYVNERERDRDKRERRQRERERVVWCGNMEDTLYAEQSSWSKTICFSLFTIQPNKIFTFFFFFFFSLVFLYILYDVCCFPWAL
jgi:hypothetical protein